MLQEANCELDILYNAFQVIQNENPEDFNCEKLVRFYYDENGNTFSPYARFFSFLVAYNKFGGFPKIVSDKDFKKIKADEIYHGFKESKYAADFIFDISYHLGVCKAFGTYFSNKFHDSLNYTWTRAKNKINDYLDYVVSDKKKIIKAKVVSDNFIHIDDVKKLKDNIMYTRDFNSIDNLSVRQKLKDLYEYCFKYDGFEDFMKLGLNPRGDFFDAIVADEKMLALYLGYDYMIKDPQDKGRSIHTVVFNRSKIVFPESEVERFKEVSEKHKESSYILSSLDDIILEAGNERTWYYL